MSLTGLNIIRTEDLRENIRTCRGDSMHAQSTHQKKATP